VASRLSILEGELKKNSEKLLELEQKSVEDENKRIESERKAEQKMDVGFRKITILQF